MNFDDYNEEELRGLDEMVKEGRKSIPWWERMMLKFFPWLYFKKFAKKMGIENPSFDQLHEVFSKTERVDLFPLNSQRGRGFLLVLDQKTALYFYQDGDRFIYDGFEMGEYEKGDVTVFDEVSRDRVPSPYRE